MKRRRLSSKQREELFHRLDGQCHICMQTIQRNERWEVSHPIPLELGGGDDDSNRAPAHYGCHKWQTSMVDIPAIAKAKRIVRREFDFSRARRPLPGGRSDNMKKCMDGTVVDRRTGLPWRGGQ